MSRQNFIGTDTADIFYGGEGRQAFDGFRGDDIIYGGAGNDGELYGASGDDVIYGGAGDDHYSSVNDEEMLFGSLIAEFGSDTLYGGSGDDWLAAFEGNHIIYGGSGSDDIDIWFAPDSSARIYAGSGEDKISFVSDGQSAPESGNMGAPYVITDLGVGDLVQLTDYEISSSLGEALSFAPHLGTQGTMISVLNDLSVVFEGVSEIELEISTGPEGYLQLQRLPIAAQNDAFSLDEDDPETLFDVLLNDQFRAEDGAVTVEVVSDPTLGDAYVTDEGLIAFSATPDAYGVDEITYRVTDANGNSDEAVLTLTINAINDPLIGGLGDDALGTQDAPLIVDAEEGLVLTDPRTAYTDPEGNDVQLDILEAEHGTITELEDGRLHYVPDDGFEGLATVEFGVTDGDGDAQSDVFFVSVVAEEAGNADPEEGGNVAPEDESGTQSDEVSDRSDDAADDDSAGLDWLILLFLGVAVLGATQGMGGGF